ncbi:hypothetical protein Q9189_006591 [Teloschistes chrysophthalmus]
MRRQASTKLCSAMRRIPLPGQVKEAISHFPFSPRTLFSISIADAFGGTPIFSKYISNTVKMRSALFAALPALLLPAITSAYSGDMTYYTPGLGSCGLVHSSSDLVVALSIPMMGNGANPNNNPKCGSWIGIWNPVTKTKHEAQVVDTCFACQYTDIDVSPALFKLVAPDGDGRVHGIDWGGPMVGG